MNPSSIAPVTVIVPCFNEEDGVPALVTRLRALRADPRARDWRVLCIDDGSTDRTFDELLDAASTNGWIEIVRHDRNRGLGAALRTGFAATESPIVCTIDSDCTYPPERLPELTALIEAGADLATASAWHPTSAPAAGSRIRLLLSRTASRIYQILIQRKIYTFTCLYRAYRRDKLARLPVRGNGFSAVAEIMLRALLADQRVAEVPMPLEERRYGESKLRITDAIFAHLHLILVTLFGLSARFVRQTFSF